MSGFISYKDQDGAQMAGTFDSNFNLNFSASALLVGRVSLAPMQCRNSFPGGQLMAKFSEHLDLQISLIILLYLLGRLSSTSRFVLSENV